MPAIELIPCHQCGQRFARRRKGQRFCKDICRQNYHRERREQALRLVKAYGLQQDAYSWNRRMK